MTQVAAPNESRSLPVVLVCVASLCWLVTIPLWMMESLAFARFGGDTAGFDFIEFFVVAFVGASLVITAGTRLALVGYGETSSRIRLLAFGAMMAVPAGPAAIWALKGHFWYLGSLGLAGLVPFLYAACAPKPTFRRLLRIASCACSAAFVLPMLAITMGESTDLSYLGLTLILLGLPALATTLVFLFTRPS